MADYAGAVAAIKQRFESGWSSATPIAYQNEGFADQTAPWVYFEVLQTESSMRGFGRPGSQTWLTLGLIAIHIAVPKGYGLADQLTLADAAGEIFRAQTFYTTDAGAKVICGAPSIQGGDSAADNGNWFMVSVSIPFEFYFLA